MTGSTASGPGNPGPGWRGDDVGARGITIEGECPWCRTGDPTTGQTCLNCGRPLGAAVDRIGTTAADAPTAVAATTATGPSDRTSSSPPPWAPPPVPRQPTVTQAAVTPPPAEPVVVEPVVVTVQPEPAVLRALDEPGRSRTLEMLGWAGVAAAFVVILAIVLTTRDSDGGRASETLPSVLPAPPATTIAQAPPVITPAPEVTTIPPFLTSAPVTALPTVPVTTTPVQTAPPVTSPAATAPPATAPPATAPPVTAPVTQPAPTSTPTSAPAPVVQTGPGSPQVLNDPLPSGVTAQTASRSFALAQRLADALANEDWDTARQIDVDARESSDEVFEAGYGGLDRASLMLVDAVPDGAGFRLLVVSVANELDGARTSMYCLEWSSDPVAGTIDQHSDAVGLVARVPVAMTPEAVRQDPSLDRTIRDECQWSSS
jgi:hypothetical protein